MIPVRARVSFHGTTDSLKDWANNALRKTRSVNDIDAERSIGKIEKSKRNLN